MVRAQQQPEKASWRRHVGGGFRQFSRDDSGASALEFALLATPLLLLLLAVFQVAFVYFATFALEGATTKAARLVRTGQAQSLTIDQLKDEVCKELVAPLSCSGLQFDIRKYANFGEAGSGLTSPLDGSDNMKTDFSYDTGVGGEVMVVRAFYPLDIGALLPAQISLSNMSGNNRVLIATAAFRNEPF